MLRPMQFKRSPEAGRTTLTGLETPAFRLAPQLEGQSGYKCEQMLQGPRRVLGLNLAQHHPWSAAKVLGQSAKQCWSPTSKLTLQIRHRRAHEWVYRPLQPQMDRNGAHAIGQQHFELVEAFQGPVPDANETRGLSCGLSLGFRAHCLQKRQHELFQTCAEQCQQNTCDSEQSTHRKSAIIFLRRFARMHVTQTRKHCSIVLWLSEWLHTHKVSQGLNTNRD